MTERAIRTTCPAWPAYMTTTAYTYILPTVWAYHYLNTFYGVNTCPTYPACSRHYCWGNLCIYAYALEDWRQHMPVQQELPGPGAAAVAGEIEGVIALRRALTT